jgi:hypothetical protein
LLQWFWTYLTRRKGARLVTGLRPLFPSVRHRSASPPDRPQS